MGSPEKPNKSTKPSIASTTSPQSAAFQDSPIFNYINNLSPIKPVKGTSVIQGFLRLSSPPLVFTSPRINTHRQSTDLKRSQCHVSSHSESSQQDDTNKHITTRAVEVSQMSSELNLHNKQEHGNNSFRHDKTGSSSGCVDDYLTDLSEIVCANSSLKQSEDGPPEVADSVNPYASMEKYDKEDDKGNTEQAKEDHEGNLSSHPKPAENNGKNQSNICQKVPSNISEGHISVQQYNQRIIQVSQGQLGKRKRLQFGEAQEITVENDPASPNPSNTLASSELQDSFCADIPSTPSNIQLTGSTQSTCPLSSSQNTRNASLTISKPSGIGLHLNSIVNARPLRWVQNVSINPIDRSYLSAGGKKSVSLKRQCPSVSSNPNLVENVSARSEEYMHETPASYSNTNFVNVIEHQEKFDEESLSSEQAEKVNELNRSNPKKKRKKTESTGDGCKHCNCKKTKCLKLYCDCFAAGIYCSDSCSCQGCFNKPEYEETVLETRQQIESRNPLAFAPKVVHRITQPPRSESGEDGDQVTPLAGRHKRGCNCKKSMCLKKYCECFQANVGCSDGCRCEGCQNMYGKKEVFGMSREMGSMEAMNGKLNDSFDDKLKVGSIRPRSSLSEFHKPQNLTPQTPSFQRSDHRKDASKACLFHQRYLPSPESDCLFYPPRDSANYEMLTETSNENLEIAALDQESYPHLEFMDEFSPGCPSSNNNTSRPQLSFPSFSSDSSLHFHGSPVTPVTLFGAKKPTESKQKYVDMIHYDTPNILKDSSTELSKVRVRSPNKKRVSPPKMRLHELGLSSLKSGRKFILKAVPSFPPLTPCIDLKDGTTGQNSNDPSGDNTL